MQPLFGQSADIFGRRYPILTAVALFTVGSGICGAAPNMQTLIAGRAVQGIGAGGVNALNEIIVCDLVPLRRRGQYIALIFGLISLGAAAGPIFGGLIVTYTSWKWAFWLSLPIGAASFFMLVIFLHVNHNRQGGIIAQISRIDWLGNVIFIAAVIAILIALSTASTQYSWSSWRILVPLLVGSFVGLPLFLVYEGSKFCIEPTMPLRLFGNRTTSIALGITFLHAINTAWTIYFLPVYFQGVKVVSPARSGVMLIPTIIVMLPFVILGGKYMEIFGRFKPVHLVGLALMMLGFGLFTLLDHDSSAAAWIMFQIVEVAGIGLVVAVLLPAVQASLQESDTALSASTWAFIRSFGLVWGVAIPSTIFNSRFDQLAGGRIDDRNAVATLSHGKAYEHATKSYLESLPSKTVQNQVISVFRDSMKEVWLVGLAFTGVAFVLALFENEVELRKEVETEYGLKSGKRASEKGVDVEKKSGSEMQGNIDVH